MIENAIRAIKLDASFYNAVENDEKMTGQAGLLVLIVSLLSGLGAAFVNDGAFFRPLLFTTIGGLIGWVVWAAVTAFVGKAMFNGDTNFGEMLRVTGFAQAPRFIGFIPFLGWIGYIWALVAMVVAVKEGQDFSLGSAIGTVVVGWLALLLLGGIFGAIF